ncbi:hypothetical protein GCM10018966_045160 [Streptomyces yanii]
MRTRAPDETEAHPGDIMMKGTPAGRVGSPDALARAAVTWQATTRRSSTEPYSTSTAAGSASRPSPGCDRAGAGPGASARSQRILWVQTPYVRTRPSGRYEQ